MTFTFAAAALACFSVVSLLWPVVTPVLAAAGTIVAYLGWRQHRGRLVGIAFVICATLLVPHWLLISAYLVRE